MLDLFTKHPKSVNETYLQHFCYACPTGLKMIIGGLACLMHGFFPFMFERTGSKMALKIASDMEGRQPK